MPAIIQRARILPTSVFASHPESALLVVIKGQRFQEAGGFFREIEWFRLPPPRPCQWQPQIIIDFIRSFVPASSVGVEQSRVKKVPFSI